VLPAIEALFYFFVGVICMGLVIYGFFKRIYKPPDELATMRLENINKQLARLRSTKELLNRIIHELQDASKSISLYLEE